MITVELKATEDLDTILNIIRDMRDDLIFEDQENVPKVFLEDFTNDEITKEDITNFFNTCIDSYLEYVYRIDSSIFSEMSVDIKF